MNCKGGRYCPSGNEPGNYQCRRSMCPSRRGMRRSDVWPRQEDCCSQELWRGYYSSSQVVWEFLTGSRKLPVWGQVIPGLLLWGFIPSAFCTNPASHWWLCRLDFSSESTLPFPGFPFPRFHFQRPCYVGRSLADSVVPCSVAGQQRGRAGGAALQSRDTVPFWESSRPLRPLFSSVLSPPRAQCSSESPPAPLSASKCCSGLVRARPAAGRCLTLLQAKMGPVWLNPAELRLPKSIKCLHARQHAPVLHFICCCRSDAHLQHNCLRHPGSQSREEMPVPGVFQHTGGMEKPRHRMPQSEPPACCADGHEARRRRERCSWHLVQWGFWLQDSF